MKTLSTVIFSTLLTFVLAGCNSSDSGTTEKEKEATPDTKTVAFVNTHCPIMMGKIDPKGATTTWQGKTVGYCCDECKATFEKLSDKDKKKALTKAEKEGVDVDHDDLDHDHGDHEHGDKDDHDHGDKDDHDHKDGEKDDHDHDKKKSE